MPGETLTTSPRGLPAVCAKNKKCTDAAVPRRRKLPPTFIMLGGLMLVLATFQVFLLESSAFQTTTQLTPLQQNQGLNTTRTSRKEQQQQQHPTKGPLVLREGPIFYNLFVPGADPKAFENTQRIVQEQLLQRDWTCPKATIRYVLILDDTNHSAAATTASSNNNRWQSFQDFVSSRCHNTRPDQSGTADDSCQLVEHRRTGNEDVTLQRLWEYCRAIPSVENEDWLVTYIHDKGSFSNTTSNEQARRRATQAALDCRNAMLQQQATHNSRACNICMGEFHVFPQYLASANMWTARCSYIRGLYPPQQYAAKLQEMYDSTLNHSTLQYTSQYVCLKPYHDAPNFWGLGRYAYERWPVSHPNVKPCEVVLALPLQETPQLLRKAPHESAKSVGIAKGPYKSSFARLKGRLFEWKYIYGNVAATAGGIGGNGGGGGGGGVPPNNSWIWKWYRGYEEGTPGFLNKCRALLRNETVRENIGW